MKSLVAVCLSLLLTGHVHARKESPRRDVHEIQVRGGIPNLLRKARAADGREIRVAYLGGSITAAPGWRVKSLEDFQKRFPDVRWKEIHAAIGGTGSDLGVFRLQQDALAHKPDLLFVEFAVNDGGTAPEWIHRAMEGIVRQTWQANPETDIIFVYTVSEPFLADLRAGKCSRAVTAMEELADHYAIPSMHFGVEVRKRMDAGTLVFRRQGPGKGPKPGPDAPMTFSHDGVHPLIQTGQVLYAETVARGFDELEKARPATAATPHPLGKPMRADHWADAKLVPLEKNMLDGRWRKLNPANKNDHIAKRFAKSLPHVWQTATPGATLSFKFKGEAVGFYDILGPDGGQLKVRLNDDREITVPRFDRYCVSHRPNKFIAAANLPKDAVHRITVTLDEAGPDKRALLSERNRPEFDKNPGKFNPKVWNVGSIMLIGEVVE